MIWVPVIGHTMLSAVGTYLKPLAGSSSIQEPNSIEQVKADAASPTLNAPLSIEQQSELFEGLANLIHDKYADALPVLGKYALQGDHSAQRAIGFMYYSGLGVPTDRVESVKWLRLAAAQGDDSDRASLIDAINGNMKWDTPNERLADATAAPTQQSGIIPTLPQVGVALPRHQSA